ncbi:MAG TPA: RDD family protein, partial [Candidatus Elarobacter sp.]|nr:RDD family protein [Candidatus Elarobacter sp.]
LVIQAIIPAAHAVQTKVMSGQDVAKALASEPDAPPWLLNAAKTVGATHAHTSFSVDPAGALFWLAFFVYGVVLVALIGQTFGMMVSDLRVVGANREARIGFGRAIGRYVSLVASLFAVVGWFSIFRRVQPYEKWSRTRLVSGSAAVRS